MECQLEMNKILILIFNTILLRVLFSFLISDAGLSNLSLLHNESKIYAHWKGHDEII